MQTTYDDRQPYLSLTFDVPLRAIQRQQGALDDRIRAFAVTKGALDACATDVDEIVEWISQPLDRACYVFHQEIYRR